MKVYLTVCYDEDQQQAFWDYVPAKDEDDAKNVIGAIRGGYADIVDVITPDDLTGMAKGLQKATPKTTAKELDELRAQHPSDEGEEP